MGSSESARLEKLHTIPFVVFGAGILLSYGLGTAYYSLPKWIFLSVAAGTIGCWAAFLNIRSGGLRLDHTDLILIVFCAYAALGLLWAPDRQAVFCNSSA